MRRKSNEPWTLTFSELDEYDYWPDKSKDHAPMSPKWRLAFYDEFDTYYHKSGALSMSEDLTKLINILKELKWFNSFIWYNYFNIERSLYYG